MDEINNIGDQKRSKISVIQALRSNGPIARIDLSRITGLSRATITMAISELMESRLVTETHSQYSTGGRPATLLELTPYSRLLIGADYNNQAWTLGAFDLLGNPVSEASAPVGQQTPDVVVGALVEHLIEFIERLEIQPIKLIGIGMPGLIDVRRGAINSASDLGWHEVDIMGMISDIISWPVVIVNRHRARGLAECRFGVGKSFNEVIYIGIGTGIACGLFNNGQILLGADGGAGELGHITMNPYGPLCPCGNTGCLQQLATGPAMEREARMLLRSGQHSAMMTEFNGNLQLVKADDVCKYADQEDELCMQVVRKAATYLGIAMANLVNILNPEMIILGGPVPAASDLYVSTATAVMHQRAMSPLNANVKVSKASYSTTIGALGVANFALDLKIGYSLFTDDSPSGLLKKEKV